MRYHYKIISSWDPTDIHTDSRNWDSSTGDFEGFSSFKEADEHGEKEMERYNLNSDQYYVSVSPIPETEEDHISLNKTWDDIFHEGMWGLE